MVHKYETTCPICLDDFNKHSTVVVLECRTKHVFHSICLDRWITQEHNTCPVCRDVIIEDFMGEADYTTAQNREINSLRRDQDIQELAQCPFGWPF